MYLYLAPASGPYLYLVAGPKSYLYLAYLRRALRTLCASGHAAKPADKIRLQQVQGS